MGLTLRAAAVGLSRNGRVLLDEVTLEARSGEVLVLLGPSGGGKTTLLRVLHGLMRPDTGRVIARGTGNHARTVVEPRHVDRRWIEQVALVQQRPGLLSTTTREDVAFALRARGRPRRASEEAADHWLRTLGLAELADAPTRRLSGGEAQRVALARALALDAPVLLLDECTNQLDPRHTAQVEALVRARADAGATVVLVTHSVNQARRLADRFVHLARGTVVEAGDRSALDTPVSEATRAFLRHA